MIRDADTEMTVVMEVYMHRSLETGGTQCRATWGTTRVDQEAERRRAKGKVGLSLYCDFLWKEWVRCGVSSLRTD